MHKRFKNPPELPSGDLQNPERHLATRMVSEFRKYARESDRLVCGEIGLETENPEGLHILYQCFPSGDFFCWFIENGFFTLIALVDEKTKTLCKLPTSKWEEFNNTLQTVVVGMCGKNGYNPDLNIKQSNQDNPPEVE